MSGPLPVTSLVQAAADLREFGCCVVRDALTSEECAHTRTRLLSIAADEVARDTDFVYSNGCNQRVWSLLNKDDVFVALAEHEIALALVAELLDRPFLLSNLSANIAGHGGEPMVVHNDQLYAPRPWPYALAATVIWALDDFTAENGATEVSIGSHRIDDPPAIDTLTPIECPAGSALCLDARLWHRTGANRTATRRHALLAYYCRPFVRQQENFFVSLDPRVHVDATVRLRSLLGWEPYEYIGMIDGADRNAARY